MNDGAAEPTIEDFAFFVHDEDRGKCEAVDVGHKAADVIGKDLRQHRDRPVDEIDRRGSLQGLCVDGSAGANVMRNVSDVDADFIQFRVPST